MAAQSQMQLASSGKQFVDFVKNYTPQLLSLMCGMVLWALLTFQRAQGHTAGRQQDYVEEPFGAFAPPLRAGLQVGVQGRGYAQRMEDLMFAIFVLWCLKPFVDLLLEVLAPLTNRLVPFLKSLQSGHFSKSQGMLKDSRHAAYGSLSKSETAANECCVQVQPDQPGIPASHTQEPMLTWQYLHPQVAAHNEGWCIWLQGPGLSLDALRASFRNIVEKHTSLRTKFTLNEDATWTQHVIPVHQVFPHIFSQVDALGDEQRALQLAQEAFNKPLKIFTGSSSRLGIMRVSSSKVLVYVIQHHVGTDGVSMPVFYEALKKQYLLALQPSNKALVLLASPLQALEASAAETHASLASRPGVKESLEWWRQHLEGSTTLDLPTDYVRKPQPSFNSIHVPLRIPAELSGKIQALAQSEGVTVFDVLLALYSTWLSKMAGQEDVTVWSSHHGRSTTAGKMDDALGCFRTYLFLRLAPHGKFGKLLHAASQEKKDGMRHCNVPAMSLLEACGINSQSSGIVNVFNYYSDRYNKAGVASAAAKGPFADGVQASLVELPKRSKIPDVEMSVSKDSSGCLYGHADFSADLFTPATSARMMEYFVTMASTAVSDVSVDISELPLLTPSQERELDNLHGPKVELRSNVVELLARCIKTAPDSLAVEYEPTGERLTYAELGARVRGLAAHLSTLGICRDVLCAIMLDRSTEMVVAIYSIWWAGGAYIPIEPSATEKYLEFIVEDLRVHNGSSSLAMLTQSWILERRALEELFTNVVTLDAFKPRVPGTCECPEQGFPEAGQLCYSIYTSGSTGRPKGVLLQHQGLANYIEECRQVQGVTSQDVVMQKTPYIFDVSLYEFAMPLTVAAKLLVAKHEGHKDVAYVADAMRRGNVTVTRFIPSYLDIFLDHIKTTDKGKAVPLRAVGCSGEAMHTPTCLTFLQLLPEAELYDLYGPTEGTVDVTLLPCTGKALRSGKTIGKPLGGCRIYVGNFLETAGGRWNRTPVGLHGELLIGGVQVGRGYLNLPEKTSNAFIQNPFNDGQHDIVYRTGDVVKWRADGHVVYIGRADNQVKVSGVRIELGEIECAVSKVPGVREGVVKMLKDAPGGASRLVAYVAPASAATDRVVKYCREVLPHYMIPSACVGIDEWPRTASGKIDLKQLPIPPVHGEESDEKAASFAFLNSKIKELGLVGAMGDEEVQQQGWNSFQLMTLHAEMMRDPEKFTSQVTGSSSAKEVQSHDPSSNEALLVHSGVISIVGHMWVCMMFLVLLEWLVAYWEWYGAAPAASGFQLSDYPFVERLNALGRFMGDPVFIMLSAIQDMTDAQAGKTGQLLRRTALFMGICAVFTVVDRVLLQGPYVRNGWINVSWALDTTRMCGVLNGSSFVFARAVFIPFPLIFSMGRISWIRLFGILEWPWVCLMCSIFVPALMKGIPKVYGFGDGSAIGYIQATNDFICELSPYYFLYPLFIGGIRFPRPIAALKVRSSVLKCSIITAISMLMFYNIWTSTHIENTNRVNEINDEHRTWKSWLMAMKKVNNWPLLDQISKSFDLWAAFLAASFVLSFAAMMPVTPGPFSLMGTRVIACYLTMPLTLILAGHYLAPCYIHISGPWHSACGSIGVITTLVLVLSVTTAQNVLPEVFVRWASDMGTLAKDRNGEAKA